MASRTEHVNIQGKVKWFRYKQPNKFGKWSHDMYPNNEGVEKIRELQAKGLKNVLKKDDEGYYITFSRPTSREMRGKVIGFTPPLIFGPDGVTQTHEDVGNGSDVTTKLEVYSYGGGHTGINKGIAARWLSSKIDNLIPFDTGSFADYELEAQKGLPDAPPQWS
jgi:hypothetical protein